MAGQTKGGQPFNPYLSNAQQELLLAALASNNPKTDQFNGQTKTRTPTDMASLDFDDTSPYLEYLDADTSFGFDSTDLGGQQMFDSLPSNASHKSDSTDGDKPDKRKSPEEDSDDEENDPKRREGDPKEAKKPGRKPLTSEPTTKRKAQNRAAQRAFRERKERHLKDLETKVESLTQAQEKDKHENGILKAQVQRLQAELIEYRKRMSYSSNGIGGNSPPSNPRLTTRSNSNPQSDFQFDFPKFGALPGAQLFGNDPHQARGHTVSPPINQYPSNPSRNQSPGTQSNQPSSGHNSRSGSMNNGVKNSTIAQTTTSDASYADLFSPSMLNGLNSSFPLQNTSPSDGAAFAQYADNGTDSNSGISRVFRFNSSSNSTSSPSVPSLSQFNNNSSCNNSSCGTSPESSNSPPSDSNKAMGNDFSDVYSLNQMTAAAQKPSNTLAQPNVSTPNFDWFATQNGGQFDPVLFGDYRESQDAIVGDGDFNSGFFDAAFPYDLGSPFNNLGDMAPSKPAKQPSASRNLMAEVERCREGNDDDDVLQQPVVIPQSAGQNGKGSDKLLTCNTIWSQLQSNQDFKEGKFDLDNLCAELRAKAKCSETGVTVPSEYVDAAFKKLSGTHEQPPIDEYHATHDPRGIDYLFNQYSVDEAIKKLGA